MAFCCNKAGCGHDCGRQDDHGGSCNCYEQDCHFSNGYVSQHLTRESVAPLTMLYAVRRGTKYYCTCVPNTCWVDVAESAKLWTRPGPAADKIVSLTRDEPDLPTPELVVVIVTEIYVVDKTENVVVARNKKAIDKAIEKEMAAKIKHQKQLQKAQFALSSAESRLRSLQER